jgi:ketosteroid isomerase-like protein
VADDRVAIVRGAVEAFNRRDWDGFLQHAAEDFQFDLSRATGPEHGVFTADETRELLDRFAEPWESLTIETDELVETEDHVVAAQTLHARGRDEIDVPSRVTWVWTFADGAVVRMTMYQEWADAAEAVRLKRS